MKTPCCASSSAIIIAPGVNFSKNVPPILEVHELRVAYRSPDGTAPQALAGVTFDVNPGEILGVLGESGSGKSTLAASLLRLLPSNGKIVGGRIVLEGQ